MACRRLSMYRTVTPHELLQSLREHSVKRGSAKRRLLMLTTHLTTEDINENEHPRESRARKQSHKQPAERHPRNSYSKSGMTFCSSDPQAASHARLMHVSHTCRRSVMTRTPYWERASHLSMSFKRTQCA